MLVLISALPISGKIEYRRDSIKALYIPNDKYLISYNSKYEFNIIGSLTVSRPAQVFHLSITKIKYQYCSTVT